MCEVLWSGKDEMGERERLTFMLRAEGENKKQKQHTERLKK